MKLLQAGVAGGNHRGVTPPGTLSSGELGGSLGRERGAVVRATNVGETPTPAHDHLMNLKTI